MLLGKAGRNVMALPALSAAAGRAGAVIGAAMSGS
ncbi:hypothetical protein SUDANB145_01176 [Streptomyces sp. enrichment culture]